LSATADGKRLAYVNERHLLSVYLGDLENNGLRLVNPRRLTIPSPDGHHLALAGQVVTRNVWMSDNFWKGIGLRRLQTATAIELNAPLPSNT
jgi:hypothetical protein